LKTTLHLMCNFSTGLLRYCRPIFRGWHLGTEQRAPRPKGATCYSSSRRNKWWIDRSI